jgi:hypothetical protein
MNVVYEVTDALRQSFFSSLKSSVTDFGYFLLFPDNVRHCFPLILVQFTIPEVMFLRLMTLLLARKFAPSVVKM